METDSSNRSPLVNSLTLFFYFVRRPFFVARNCYAQQQYIQGAKPSFRRSHNVQLSPKSSSATLHRVDDELLRSGNHRLIPPE